MGFFIQTIDYNSCRTGSLDKIIWSDKENVYISLSQDGLEKHVGMVRASQSFTKAVSALYAANFRVKMVFNNLISSRRLKIVLSQSEVKDVYYTIAVMTIYIEFGMDGIYFLHKRINTFLESKQLQMAIVAIAVYIKNSHQQISTFHNSTTLSKKFLNNILHIEKPNKEKIIREAKSFISGTGKYRGPKSGNGKHSRRTLLSLYLGYKF
ncbi:hypothetical protein [Piscirickettsia litoralis]|uniref:Uncharacterized protein n=1 Tax=Piscirickettsia litoralis TaxID=1891921 RepID=A0ABX2ZZM7_9GAMM|nr:hypothetical protein [Piscirickettsia litoralis]ODN41482.1 hypothetical protein BGC07_15315 [Piscirickettsia litoralis]